MTDASSGSDRLDALVGDVAAVAADLPVSALLTGSAETGAFSPHLSDVDVVLVARRNREGTFDAAREAFEPLRSRPLGDRLDVVFVPAAAFPGTVLHGRRLDGSPAVLHEMDVLLLRDHSRLLAGDDVRGDLPDYGADEVIDGVVDHVIHEMLPGAVAACPTAERAFLDDVAVPYAFVLARCLYTLDTGGVATKPDVAAWLADRARERSSLAALADLVGTFAGWYRDGRPDDPPVADLTRRFVPAAASFLSAVADRRGTPVDPDSLLAAPDPVEAYDRAVDA